MLVALGLAVTLGVAGLLEAYVTPSGLPTAVRIGIGALVWLAFLAYALVVGRAPTAGRDRRPRPGALGVTPGDRIAAERR